jgi:LmbE family N-acetylglucosaminyl deacetylase
MRGIKATVLVTLLALSASGDANAQPQSEDGARLVPSVLIVTAHPDDDALFGGLVYRLAMELGARVELAVVTDGAGGYRYSTLAEPVYGLKLTDPEVARKYLPGIRKREVLAGGKFVGIRDYHFLDQPDTGFTTDPDSILEQVWDGALVQQRLQQIMSEGDFAFVLTHLPMESTHGHHKSASILAVRAAAELGEDRPVVLAAWFANKGDTTERMFDGLPGYPDAGTTTAAAPWRFDRTRGLGLDGRLNYKIPVNWLISEHKSQGTMQQLVNLGDLELYWLYTTNPPDATERADALFDLVNTWTDPG